MSLKLYLITILVFLVSSSGSAQIKSWTTLHSGDLRCDFPREYKSVTSGIVHSDYFDGENMFLAVTAMADTFRMKGDLDRDYSRDFAEVVLATSRRLQGRVREYRDTVIGNQPGYISRQEVKLRGGDKAYYDLVQVLHQDSIRGFSSQYLIGDKKAEAATARFFGSIRMSVKGKESKSVSGVGYWIAGGLVLVAGAWVLLRKRKH
jgi:hypothetical protein